MQKNIIFFYGGFNMAGSTLTIKDLHVSDRRKRNFKRVNLEIKGGEIHAIMGPNGTGKSTLAQAIMGHPKYEVTKGTVDIGWRRCSGNGSG